MSQFISTASSFTLTKENRNTRLPERTQEMQLQKKAIQEII